MIKAILFDLHGVLFTNSTKTFIEKLTLRTGLPKTKIISVFDEGIGVDYREGRASHDEFWSHVSKGLKLENVDELEKEWMNEYRLIEGTRDLIFKLMKKYRIFYLSDNFQAKIDWLHSQHQFLDWFEGGLSSHEVGARKPDLKMYEKAIEQINLQPEEILFIDDKDINLPPAHKLGMQTILFTTPEDLEARLESLKLL